MKKRLLALLLAAMMLIPMLAACNQKDTDAPGETDPTTQDASLPTETPTETPTEEPFVPFDPPSYEIDPNASIYSGTPDTSWYTGDKTEYILTSADQLVGFHQLRSETFNYEGITVKLACDVILNAGTAEEIKARGSENHSWAELNSGYLFKGTFDGQGHIISGLYMQLVYTGLKGMFGGVGGNAVLKDFTLINSYFGGPSAEGKIAMGSIAAKVAGTDANVTFSGVNVEAILESGTAEFSRIGGLIGQVTENLTLTMENCNFSGSVTVNGDYAGGMIGYAGAKELTVYMKDCANYGNISARTYAGGMTGVLVPATATQTNCQNYGAITATHDEGDLNGRLSMINDPTNGARPTAPDGTTALRIMSFNVQAELSTENGVLTQAAQNRVEAVKQEILYYSPDIFGLQEDNQKWIFNLKLDDYNVIKPASGTEEHCAIYYKKGLKLLAFGTEWLTATRTSSGAGLTYEDLSTPGSKYYMTPEELAIIGVSNTADLKAAKSTYIDQETGNTVTMKNGVYTLLDTRRVTWGVFDINGQTVIYMNTHLQHRSPSAEYSNDTFQKVRNMERLKEFDLMQETLAKIKKEHPNALVCMTADWNDLPYTDIYESIVTDYGYVCANFDTDEKYGVDGSWNNAFNLSLQGDNYPSKNEGTSGSYLDYLFMDREIDTLKFRVGAGKAEITAVDGSKKTIYTSDHLPIIADICFKTQQTGSPIDPDYKDPNENSDPTVYSGTPDFSWYTKDKNEYILTTADQLMGFQYLRAQKASFEGVTIKLGNDITINQGTMEEIIARGDDNYLWEELNSNDFFLGTFDGQGYTVSGIYMKMATGYKAMFGGVSGKAVIKNFNLENSYFCTPDANKVAFGCIVARVSNNANVTISNVNVRNTTMQEQMGKVESIGGFVGVVESGCTLTVENCEFGGSIEFGTKGTKVGGIVGAASSSATVALKNCKFTGSIDASDTANGMIGYTASGANVTETDCASTGEIK